MIFNKYIIQAAANILQERLEIELARMEAAIKQREIKWKQLKE